VALARRVEAGIRKTVDLLAEHPALGSKTSHRHDVRRWAMSEYPYTFFYRIDPSIDTITILRVIDSRRVRNLKRVPAD
jgi:plasmid stabilization system protein ParE